MRGLTVIWGEKNTGLGDRSASSVSLGILLGLSESPFPQPQNDERLSTYFKDLLRTGSENMVVG